MTGPDEGKPAEGGVPDPEAVVPPPNPAPAEAPVWTARDQVKLLENMLVSAPTLHEVLAHPERYEKWYADSREALNA